MTGLLLGSITWGNRMKILLLTAAIICIPLLGSCVPNSGTPLEPAESTTEQELLAQVENCFIKMHNLSMAQLMNSFYADQNVYEKATEIIAYNLLINANMLLNNVLNYESDWDIREISTNVYSVSGYGLGYKSTVYRHLSDREYYTYGEWYYYASPDIMEPRSSVSSNLKDAITVEGPFAEDLIAPFPNSIHYSSFMSPLVVPTTQVPFIWTGVSNDCELLISKSEEDLQSKQAQHGYITPSDVCISVNSSSQYYVLEDKLDYNTVYYWKVIGWKVVGWQSKKDIEWTSPVYCFFTEGEVAEFNRLEYEETRQNPPAAGMDWDDYMRLIFEIPLRRAQ